jgi:hypothetical protein
VLLRTVLLAFLVPAIIWDRDGRGLHDKAAGALTIRVGAPTRAGARSSAAPAASAPPGPAASPTKATNAAAKSGATPKPPVRRRKKRR